MLIKEAGFDGVFLYSQYNPEVYIDSIIESGLQIETLHLSYKQIVEGNCINSQYVNCIWQDNDDTNKYVSKLISEIDFASSYGIDKVVMHITGGNNPPEYNENGLKHIETILNHCARNNIILCLENLRRLDYLIYVFDNLYSDYLKFCFDSGHANYMTKNANSFPWDVFGKYLSCLHLNDNSGEKDSHSIPFTGAIKWESLVGEIRTYAKDIGLTLEVRASKEQASCVSEKDFLNSCKSSLDRIELLYKR